MLETLQFDHPGMTSQGEIDPPIASFTFIPRLYTVDIEFDELEGLGLQLEEGPNLEKYVIGITRLDQQTTPISLMDRIVGVQGKDVSSLTGDQLEALIRSLAQRSSLLVITLESSYKQTISFICCFCRQTNHCDDDNLIRQLKYSVSFVQLNCFRCNRKCTLICDDL